MDKVVAVYGSSDPIKLFASGKCKLSLTFSENEDRDQLIELFKNPRPVSIVPLNNEIDIEKGLIEKQEDPIRAVTNKEANELDDMCTTKVVYADKLYLSSFFRAFDVRATILDILYPTKTTDKKYMDYSNSDDQEYKNKWMWDALKKILGYDSWSDVPFKTFIDWVEENNLRLFLPRSIKELI